MVDNKITTSGTNLSEEARDYDDVYLSDLDDSSSSSTSSEEEVEGLIFIPLSKIPPETPEIIKRPKGWGRRHTTAIMAFWGLIMTYAMRFNMSLAIVGMVKSPPMKNKTSLLNGSSTSAETVDNGECVYVADGQNGDGSKAAEFGDGEFEWNEHEQGMILASFFYGYVITQLPGGWAASKMGGKWPFGIGLAISGLMTLLTPMAARTNVGMLLYCRVIEGLGQGFIFPSLQQIMAAWAPPNERSILSAMAYSGCQFGAALSMITTGYLITGAGGWSTVFYFSGTITMVWFVCWIFLGYNTPDEHPYISDEEKKYIILSIGTNMTELPEKIPWKDIFTSGPIWVLTITESCHSWGLYTLLILLPTYLKSVLSFNMEENSWLSAAPSITMWIFAYICTLIADIVISKKFARIITVRKICHMIAEIGAGSAMLGASFIGCDRTGAVILITIASGVSGGVFASYIPNQVEIACNFAGIVMGIANTVANLTGFLVTIVASAVIEDHVTDQRRWRYVFSIAAGIYFLSAFVFVLFATSKEQVWNRKRIVEAEGVTNYLSMKKVDVKMMDGDLN